MGEDEIVECDLNFRELPFTIRYMTVHIIGVAYFACLTQGE